VGKVITSAGLNDFISSGKVDEVKAQPKEKSAAQAPPLEVVREKPSGDAGREKPEEPLTDDAKDEARERSQEWAEEMKRKNAAINRKHREMMEAREAQRDAEDFAKEQWNGKRLSDERLAQLERELQELKAKAVPVTAEKKAKPDPKDFYDDKGQFKAFEYAEELAAYSASKAVEDDREAQAKARQLAEAQAAEALAKERIAQTVKKHPDFNEVMAATDLQTHNAVLQYLSASEFIGEVSYYLAKNPDFVERINKLNPLKAIAEIGKLEATFEKVPAGEKTTDAPETAKAIAAGAPPPIKSLNADAPVNTNTDPAKMSFRELRAYEKARKRKA
jgi:hypothetical protein